jgi:leucyl aminopeptidase
LIRSNLLFGSADCLFAFKKERRRVQKAGAAAYMADENLTQLCLFKDFKREMQSRLADLEYGSRRSMQDMAMRMPLR